MRAFAAFACLCAATPLWAAEPASPRVIDLSSGQDAPARPQKDDWEWTRPPAPTGPIGTITGNIAGRWILPGGDCRMPDLTLSGDGKSMATRSSSTSEEASGGTNTTTTYTYSYSSDGSADNAAKRRVDAMLGDTGDKPAPPPADTASSALPAPATNYAIVDGQLVVSSFGARRVYRRCDGARPARPWEME